MTTRRAAADEVGGRSLYGVTVAAKMSRLYGDGCDTPVQVKSAPAFVEEVPVVVTDDGRNGLPDGTPHCDGSKPAGVTRVVYPYVAPR